MFHRDQLYGSSHEVLVRRDEVEPVDLGIDCDPFDWLIEDQCLVKGSAGRIARESQGARGISLGIAVDDEGALFRGGEGGPEVYGRGCLAYATLLISNRYDPRQYFPQCAENVTECFRAMQGVSRETISLAIKKSCLT